MQKIQDFGLKLWNKWKSASRRVQIASILGFLAFVWFLFCLPSPLFDTPHSTVVYSSDHHLLGAKIAADGQWRFPAQALESDKFRQAIIAYEDEYFYYHPGFNPFSMAKALLENLRTGEVKRGGSTITQQTVRLMRSNPKRTYLEKLYEITLAFRLELGYSKNKILSLYSSYAPFGGNVVGVSAASWRYFGRESTDLSWAEAATLAVLPNAPGLIHPGRNRETLKQKRDWLLFKLFEQGKLDELTYELSIQEGLPDEPIALPRLAPHFVEFVNQERPEQQVLSSIDFTLQQDANRIVNAHYLINRQNQVNNIAVLIADVHTKEILAYVGNTDTNSRHQNQVDMVQANRSTGSLLKPFLYASALDAGKVLPHMLIADVPTYYHNYAPQNFNLTFQGALPASKSLVYSTNVTAVRLLHDYGIPKFHAQLQLLELKGVKFSPDYYGLPLILGGAESSLWDLTKAYAGMSSTLNHFNEKGKYYSDEFSQLTYLPKPVETGKVRKQFEVVSAGSIWHTLNTITELERPIEDRGWKYFESNKKIAWKTGTSYGNKDAWAIGTDPNYVVGVWVGNADGEGRAGTTGVQNAAPILFDLFNLLPNSSSWFAKPTSELYAVETCKQSGYLRGTNCPEYVTEWLSKPSLDTKACPYHELIHTTLDEAFQVNNSCVADQEIKTTAWFVLPPKEEVYYMAGHPEYRQLPPLLEGCGFEETDQMSWIYPRPYARLSLPKELGGEKQKIVARIAHKKPGSTVYWYLDDQFLGTTKNFHELEIIPSPGNHVLSVTDQGGEQEFVPFSIE